MPTRPCKVSECRRLLVAALSLVWICAGCGSDRKPSSQLANGVHTQIQRLPALAASGSVQTPQKPVAKTEPVSVGSLNHQPAPASQPVPTDVRRCERGRLHLQESSEAKANGDLAKADEELDKAIEDFTSAIAFNQNNADAYFHRGVAFYRRRLLRAAIEDLKRATRLRKGFFDAYLQLGHAFYAKEDYYCAAYFAQRAIEMKPLSAEAHRVRANACSAYGQLDEAIAEYREAIRLEPANKAELLHRLVDTFRRLAQQHADQRDWNQAVRSITEAIALEPKQPEDYVLRATFHVRAESWPAAIQDYEQALKLDPELSDRLRPIIAGLHAKRASRREKNEDPIPVEVTPRDE